MASVSAYHGFHITAEVLDSIKAMGYKYSTKGALTLAKASRYARAGRQGRDDPQVREEGDLPKIDRKYKRGFLSPIRSATV